MNERSYRRAVSLAMLVMGTPLALSLVASASGKRERVVPVAPAVSTGCVLPMPKMRYEHMTYLKESRDRVVRDGHRRTPSASSVMSSCSGCHVDKARFCDRCHTRAGVALDCYGCHEW